MNRRVRGSGSCGLSGGGRVGFLCGGGNRNERMDLFFYSFAFVAVATAKALCIMWMEHPP